MAAPCYWHQLVCLAVSCCFTEAADCAADPLGGWGTQNLPLCFSLKHDGHGMTLSGGSVALKGCWHGAFEVLAALLGTRSGHGACIVWLSGPDALRAAGQLYPEAQLVLHLCWSTASLSYALAIGKTTHMSLLRLVSSSLLGESSAFNKLNCSLS
jgi:hypothetical protein